MVRASTIANEICGDLIFSVSEWDGVDYLVTNFKYPNRDHVVLFNDSVDGIRFSDRGITLSNLLGDGVQLTEARSELIHAICREHGAELRDQRITKDASNGLSMAFIDICHAITRIADIAIYSSQRTPSLLASQIEEILLDRVIPNRTFSRDWHDESNDPNGHYTIDFRILGSSAGRNVFHISSRPKADRVTAVCQFYKARNSYAPTLAVVRPDLELGSHFEGRLMMSTTEILYGTVGHEQEIAEFALA